MWYYVLVRHPNSFGGYTEEDGYIFFQGPLDVECIDKVKERFEGEGNALILNLIPLPGQVERPEK